MALFQRSVVSKYLKQQDAAQVQKAYKKYTKYFLSPVIQENIRQTKEEQYQGLFLTELFVKILDYTLKPNANFNLVAEYKNQNNARKADGAILKEDIAIGVIELKGTKTKDLESIRRQAFDYKANQKGCVYVITSNFEKLRFYINDATEFEEFNLFELTEERFALLYLCLHKDNILSNVPLKIKEASIQEEEQITKDFYKDYSLFKRELYRDLVKRNGKRLKNISYEEFTANTNATEAETEAEYLRLEKNVKLTLFKKSQKLIDRFLFIFFAEDRGLLPPNSTMKILEDWNKLKELDEVVPLYKRFKLYFKYLDEGRKGTDKKAEIYAYNGGLFKEDTILDTLEIDDDLLYTYAHKLAKYDFESQVDVNILGHIFENSLNEIESVNAEIEGADFDKQKSKRKKDGVFYTPKYITKYIVENTIGKLCEEKKVELDLKEEEYYKGRKNRKKDTIKNLIAILDAYREWLLQLTICDPACGSGAFLNQALDFLISEHNYIDELKAKILGGGIVFSDIENTVLENNIYGVDLNEESVEIAKLSLWLRTAQPRRKLNDLSSNIKCGNSLIDSKTVAGSKAFHWETEFPQVFREKNKKAYHITTAIHDSRTSARMQKYKVRERRDLGTNPYPNVIYFTPEDDLLISQTIATIVAEDKLNLLAYNICADHIHLLLVCELDEIPAIMQKIKSITAKHVNNTREHAPLQEKEKEHAPLRKYKNKPLWQQKYSAPKEITTEEQLHNTLKYIQTNRSKHELPKHSKEVQKTITEMCCSISQGFKTEYTGGFDVIIGNPPYGVNIKEGKDYFKKKYISTQGPFELYKFFIEKSLKLINNQGLLAYITPDTWVNLSYFKKLRKLIFTNYELLVCTETLYKVFEDAVVDTCIFIIRNNLPNKFKEEFIAVDEYLNREFKASIKVTENDYLLNFKERNSIIDKLDKSRFKLDDFTEIWRGMSAYGAKSPDRPYNSFVKESELHKKLLNGGNIGRYSITWEGEFIKYGDWLHRPRPEYIYTNPKILIQRIRNPKLKKRIVATLDYNGYISSDGISNVLLKETEESLILDLEISLAILNSKLINFWFAYYFFDVNIKPEQLKQVPIPNYDSHTYSSLSINTKRIIELSDDLKELSKKFQKLLQSQYQLEKLSKKLQNWHELSFGEFIKELNKAIKAANKLRVKEEKEPIAVLTKTDEFEWLELFETKQKEAIALQTQINATDKEIDAMVYELYGLTEDEIAIVEAS